VVNQIIEILMAIISAAGVVIWSLLRRKDEQQEKAIEELRAQTTLLFRKHDEDSGRLDAFQLEIAKHHYTAPQLDARFDRLDMSFRSGMHELGAKLDKLTDTLIARGDR
jgi:hypothetical protein